MVGTRKKGRLATKESREKITESKWATQASGTKGDVSMCRRGNSGKNRNGDRGTRSTGQEKFRLLCGQRKRKVQYTIGVGDVTHLGQNKPNKGRKGGKKRLARASEQEG